MPKNNPRDAAIEARVDKEVVTLAGEMFRLGLALTRISEGTASAFVSMEVRANTCMPPELVKAEQQIEAARNTELSEIIAKDLSRVTNVMANARLAELLAAKVEYEKRITEARTRNSEAAEAKRKLVDKQKELETNELRKSRTSLDNAIRKAIR